MTFIINNILYPALLPVGVYTMQYITVDANGCSASASQTYTITAAPAVSLTAPQTIFCLNDAPVALSVSPLGGIISGVGVVGNTPEMVNTNVAIESHPKLFVNVSVYVPAAVML